MRYKPCDDLLFVCFIDDLRVLTNVIKEFINDRAQSGGVIKKDIWIWQCLFQYDVMPRCQRMILGDNEYQILALDRDAGEGFRFRWS